MNRILIESGAFGPDGTVLLAGARAAHIHSVLRAVPGQVIKTGTLDGKIGHSRVLEVSASQVRLLPEHGEDAPEPWMDLLLAVPRPKVLKRLWPQLAALGAGRIVLLNACKVEKFYFSSQWLDAAFYRPLLVDGLMQAGLTRLPEVKICPRFKPFVEDELEASFSGTLRLLAHPGPLGGLPPQPAAGVRPLLAVGPEGGWTDYELKLLEAHGFRRFSLGERTLRTDTACVALMAVLESWQNGMMGRGAE